MAKRPSFSFYSSDFLSGVADLTMEERGQYITMLCIQHQKGYINDKAIKISVPNVSEDVLAKFEKDEDGNYYNERLRLEAEKKAQFCEKQREKVNKRWDKDTDKTNSSNTTVYTKHDTKQIPKKVLPKKEVEIEIENEIVIENENRGDARGEIVAIPITKPQKPKTLHTQARELFIETHDKRTGLAYQWDGGEAKALKLLLTKISNVLKTGSDPPTDEKVLEMFGVILQRLPEWYVTNGFSCKVINSKFNELVTQIKNNGNQITGHKRTKDGLIDLGGAAVSEDYLRDLNRRLTGS